MKSVPLLPVYQGAANDYAAISNPYYDASVADYAKSSNQSGYYNYLLAQAKLKEVDGNIFEGLEDPEDKLTKLYGATLADTKESKEWDLQIPDEVDPNKAKNFVGTEAEYLDKILELKQGIKEQEKKLSMEQAKKDAVAGWGKAFRAISDIGSFLSNIGIGAEQFLAGFGEFIYNFWTYTSPAAIARGVKGDWGWKDPGLTERVDWQAAQMAEFERKYTSYRNIYGELTTGGKIATTIAQGIGQQIPTTVANIIAPGSGYALLHVGSAAGSFNEYLTKSDVPVWEAAIKVAISTGFEMAIEKGLGKLWGATGADVAKYGKAGEDGAVRGLVKAITGKEGAKVAGRTLLRGAKDVVQETLEEFLQEWSNVAVDLVSAKINNGFEDDVKDLFKENGDIDVSKMFERTLYAALAGAVGAGFFGGIGKVRKERYISKGLAQAGYKSNIFESEYQITEDGKTRKLNFWEKIALQTNIRGMYERIQLAQQGNLSQETRNEIYQTSVMLGDFFNTLSKEDLDASLKLFNEIHDYAEKQGEKLKTVESFLEKGQVSFTLESKYKIEKEEYDTKFLTGERDLNFGTGLLQRLYGARAKAQEKGLAESEQRRAEKKAKSTQKVEGLAAKDIEKAPVTETKEETLRQAFETSQKPQRTEQQIRDDIRRTWGAKSKEDIGEEIKAIQNGERDYTAKEAQIVKDVLKSLFNATTISTSKNRKPKVTKKEQKEFERQQREIAYQEAKEKAAEERKAREDAYDKAVEQYEKASLTQLLKAMDILNGTKDALELETLKALSAIYERKLQAEIAEKEDKVLAVQEKYKDLTEEELIKKVKELEKKTLAAKAGISNVIEYESAKGMLSSFQEYNDLDSAEMSDARNAKTLRYEQKERRRKLGDKDYTWAEIQYILYGDGWYKLNQALADSNTAEQLSNDLVTEANPLLDALEEINTLQDETSKKSFIQLNKDIENTNRKAYVTNGNETLTNSKVVFISKGNLREGNVNLIKEQITEQDIINKAIELYLAPIEVGQDRKAGDYWGDRYRLFEKMRTAFFSQFPKLKKNKGESDNHFFVRMLITDIGPEAAIKHLHPREYIKGIQLVLTAVVGLEKEMGKFGDSYKKAGNKIFKKFQKAAVKYLSQHFAKGYKSTEVLYANPKEFENLLTPDQLGYLVLKRKTITDYTDGSSYLTQSKVENPQLLTSEDAARELKNISKTNRFATDILQVVQGKKSYQELPQAHPVRAFWKNTQKANDGIDSLIAANKNGNEAFQRASKTIVENATEEQIEILTNTTLGYSNVIPGYLVTNSSEQETKAGNGYTIVIENFKYDNRYYAPVVNERNETKYVYARDQRFEVVEHDETNQRIVLVPVENFRKESSIGFESTEGTLSRWPGASEKLQDWYSWKFPRFTKTLFPFIKGKSASLGDIIREDLSAQTKKQITVTDMINYPGDLLSEKFKANVGSLTTANVFQAIQDYLLDNSDGRLSLALDRSTNSYYVANAAPVYDFMSEKDRELLTTNKDGTELAAELAEVADKEKGNNYRRIKDFFPGLAKKMPAVGDIKIYFTRSQFSQMASGETTTGLSYVKKVRNEDSLEEAPTKKEVTREPKIEITFQYQNSNWDVPDSNNGQLMFVIAHEVQHILQDQFGWVWGSNADILVPSSVKTFINETPAYKAQLERVFRGLVAEQYQDELKDVEGEAYDKKLDSLIKGNSLLEGQYRDKAYRIVVYTNNIGELQANLEEPAYNGLGFVTMIEPNGKINIMTPDGRTHYAGYADQEMVTEFAKSSFVDATWWEGLSAEGRKQSRSTTELKRSNEIYQNYYKDKRKRLDKRVQGFLEDLKNEERLNKLPRDLAARIREDAATYDDFISWFKQAKDIDDYTFQLFVDNIFPGTNIKSFKELQELTLKLGYAVDEDGNIQLDSKGNPKENVFRNRGQTFSPDFDKYRAALMQYYDPIEGLKGMQKYVRQAEYLGRTVTASDVKADEEDKREFGDESVSETLEEEVFGERDRLERSIAKYTALQIREDYKNGKITEEDMNKKLRKLVPNEDGFIDIFEKFSDAQLRSMNEKLKKQAISKAGGLQAAERKITQHEATQNQKSEKQLDKEKATRRTLRKIGDALSYMTEEELREFIGDDAQYFKKDKDGLYRYQVTGKYSLTENVQAAREKFIQRVLPKVNELKAKQKGRKEAFKQAQAVKYAQEKLEAQTKKVEVTTVDQNKVAPVKQISLKVGGNVVTFNSTTNSMPRTLQKVFTNIFTADNLVNYKEAHFSNEDMKAFMATNGLEIVNMNTQDWLPVLEFFEQSDLEVEGPEANAFKAARVYMLYSMVILMKTGRTVANKDYITRANNLMQKASISTKEKNVWQNLMLRTQNKVVTQTSSYIPVKVQEEFETAMAVSVDGSDDNFAKAVIHLKEAIAEEYKENQANKPKWQTVWDKVLSFRYTAMLSSPMTWFRNSFSNRIVRRMNSWSEKIGNALTKWSWVGNKMPIDKFTEKILRFETHTEFEDSVKVPVMGKKQGDYILVGTKVKESVAKWINDTLVKNGLLHELTEGYSKYDPEKRMNNLSGVNYIVETIIDNYRKQYNMEHTFNTEFLNKFHKFVNRMISDEKFINEATLKYFGKMLTEDINKGRLDESRLLRSDLLDAKISEIFAKAQWLAFTDYMRNGNFVTKWLSELGKGDNFFAKYAIPLIAPFAQSSVNWWAETLRYSPFGLGKAIVNLIKYDKYIQKMDQRRQVRGEIATPEGFDRYLLVRNLGKGVLGTILYAIGFTLSALGIAGLSKKGDKYVIRILDKVELDISNYFNSSSVIAGIATLDTIKQVAKGQNKDWTSIFSSVLNAYGETLFLSDLLGEYRYHDGLGGYIKDLPYNFIYSLVPNMMKLVANVTHVGKTSYDTGIAGKFQRLLAGIPGMPYLLDQWAGVQVDPYTGKKYKGWGLVENGFKQFGFGNTGMNYFGISEVEREAVKHKISLNNLNGKITVEDKEYNFNKTQMNEKAGQYVNEIVGQLLDGQLAYKNKVYGKMTDEEQKEALKYYMNKARDYAKIDVWTSNGHKYYASEEMYRTLKNLGIGNVYLGSKGYVI